MRLVDVNQLRITHSGNLIHTNNQ
jgi:hypothetical protein